MNRPDDRPFNPLLFRLYASDLSEAVHQLSEEMLFDTRKISREDLTKALDRGDAEAGTAERTTKWHDQVLEVNWAPHVPTEAKAVSMSITGLQSGSFKAMLEEMRKDIAEAQNQGVAEVKAAHSEAAAEIKTTIENVKAKIKSEVSDALQEFSEFTNGGPA